MWIGFTGSKNGNDILWRWEDDFPVMFTQWGANQPMIGDINNSPSKSCVYIDKDRNWAVDQGCNLQQPFICKANVAHVEPNPPDDRGELLDCPNGWYTGSSDGNGHHCIKAFSQEVSWYEADQICRKSTFHGARLVSIHSDRFNERVKSVFLNREPIPGANKQKFWIGMSRNDDGGYAYTDGSPTVG